MSRKEIAKTAFLCFGIIGTFLWALPYPDLHITGTRMMGYWLTFAAGAACGRWFG